MDLFQCARIDKNVPIEDTIKTLVGLIKEGKFDHIGMSECSAQTLRRAHAVSTNGRMYNLQATDRGGLF